MQIISGQAVDLLSPFPPHEARRVFGWNHCFRTFSENDDVPQGVEDFTRYVEGLLTLCPAWGVVDKGQLTNQKHEAPLVGIVLLEPAGSRQAYLHFASARKAFKMGLLDEASEVIVRTIFAESTSLLRLGAYVDESNGPAKGLLKRLGFKFEGLCNDAVVRDGMCRNLVYYGLTRRMWESREMDKDDGNSITLAPDDPAHEPLPAVEAL